MTFLPVLHSTRLVRFALLLTIVAGLCAAGGRREYGEDCSITQQIVNVFRNDDNDDPNGCQTEKKLLCLQGKCGCAPSFVYQKKGFFSWLPWTRGECLVQQGLPCTNDEICVSNAQCRSYLCQCEEGYHRSREGYCTNSSQKISFNPFYFIALIFSYFVLNH